MKTAAILISGRGSNMRALVEADLPVAVKCVISNRPAAAGLEYAAARGIPTAIIDHREYADRAAFDAALARRIEIAGADLVLLAGFMRVLTEGFVNRHRGRLINIHPSLLPAFPGLDTHRRAIDSGVRIHGCTVHFVTPALDAGPIIVQAAVPVLAGDDEVALAARVLAQEHRVYPLAVKWVADGTMRLGSDGKVTGDVAADPSGCLVVPS